jgi:hypothetical protein
LLQRQRTEVGKLLRKENSLREMSQKINLDEIKPKSENSEADLKERYLNEIDPRRSFRKY